METGSVVHADQMVLVVVEIVLILVEDGSVLVEVLHSVQSSVQDDVDVVVAGAVVVLLVDVGSTHDDHVVSALAAATRPAAATMVAVRILIFGFPEIED